MASPPRPGALVALIVSGALAGPLTACDVSESNSPPVRPANAQLIRYERSGGLVGRAVKLAVTTRGRVTAVPDGHDFDLTRRQLARLKEDLERAALARVPRDNRPEHPVYDGYHYTITADHRSIYAEDGAVPDALAPLLSRLDGLLGRAGLRS